MHERMGELLKAAMGNLKSSSRPHGQLGTIRSELEDWMACEYPSDQLDREQFLQTYYKELKDKSLLAGPGNKVTAALRYIKDVRSIILANYPESAPLRRMMTRIDKVIDQLAH